jgi:cbb3-type cytochrome oxidase maturation protein
VTSLLYLLPVSLLLLGLALATLRWALRNGQFDDLDAASVDVLGDDAAPRPKSPHVGDDDDAA